MKIRATGLLLAVAMIVGLAALPAAAALEEAHVGVFTATADVGKNGFCNNDGVGAVSGGGIGLIPDIGVPKNAWFTISSGTVLGSGGVGIANLCGQLTTPLEGTAGLELKDLTGIGASCAATKGWGGYGRAVFDAPLVKAPYDIWISDLGWKATVGGTFVVTGDTGASKGANNGLLVAAVQALNENVIVSCIEKVQGNKADPDPFTVVAAYAITPVGGNANDPLDKGDKK